MRRLIIAGLVAAFAGIPAGAQSPRTEVRTVMRDGMECRERKQVKKDGRSRYDLKCKEAKHSRGTGRSDDDRDSDSDGDSDDRRDGRRDDSRYEHDRGRRGSECIDANRDNRCDRTTRPTTCTDRDRDGWCDGAIDGSRRYPSTLPEMIGGIVLGTGRRSPELQRWLGTDRVSPRRENIRDGRAERVTWIDGSGRVVQRWIDSNRDGQADAVHVYRNGALLRVIER